MNELPFPFSFDSRAAGLVDEPRNDLVVTRFQNGGYRPQHSARSLGSVAAQARCSFAADRYGLVYVYLIREWNLDEHLVVIRVECLCLCAAATRRQTPPMY